MRQIHFIDTPEECQEAYEHIKEYCDSYKSPRLGIDFEGYSLVGCFPAPINYMGEDRELVEAEAFKRTGLKLKAKYEGHTATMQIGLCPLLGHDVQFVFDIRVLGTEIITELFKPIFESVTMVAHNAVHEAKILIKEFGIWVKTWRDTLLMGKDISAGDNYDHSLDGEYKKWFNPTWFKDQTGMTFKEYAEYKKRMQTSDWTKPVLGSDQVEYAADDVRYLLYLYDEMKQEVAKITKKYGKNFGNVIRLDCNLINDVALTEARGVPLNITYHRENVVDYLEKRIAEAREGVGKYFTITEEESVQVEVPSKAKNAKPGAMVKKWIKVPKEVPLNVNSWKQILAAMEAEGIYLPDTTSDTLKKNRQKHPGIESIVRAKQANHLNNNFGMKLIEKIHSNGRLHPRFSICGTVTGRMSSSGDVNKQQIPARGSFKEFNEAGELIEIQIKDKFRTSFEVPDENWDWISIDLSQIEPTMIAQISDDPILIEELNKEKSDIHGLSGQVFLGLAQRPLKGDHRRDFIGKTGGLQVLYKAGAAAFAEFLYVETIDEPEPVKLSVQEAEQMIERFLTTFEHILFAMAEVEEDLEDFLGSHNTLRFMKDRKGFVYFTRNETYPRLRRWCLTERQEAIARAMYEQERAGEQVSFDVLSKWFKVWDEKKQKDTYWNDYNKYFNMTSREAWNHLFQAECANLFKLAIYMASEELRTIPGWDPIEEGWVSYVHDEGNLICRTEHTAQAFEIIKRNFQAAGSFFIDVCPVKVDIKKGKNWAECH